MPTFALSAMTGQHVKVALSDDGGDEVFGGCTKYFRGQDSRPPLPVSSLRTQSGRKYPTVPSRRLASGLAEGQYAYSRAAKLFSFTLRRWKPTHDSPWRFTSIGLHGLTHQF